MSIRQNKTEKEDKDMSNLEEFVIKNGVLTKYNGPGGKVVIPEGVTSIESAVFWNQDVSANTANHILV